MRLLFQGDSVTDCRRDRDSPASLGQGYVSLIAERLPQEVEVLNRGVSGDTTETLLRRWEEDCLLLKPDILTLLIGVNDTLHRYKRDHPTHSDAFRHHCKRLLHSAKAKLPGCHILVMEPFLLPVDQSREEMLPDLHQKQDILRQTAWELRLPYLALDGRFAEACSVHPPGHWLPDGVHPSPAGHRLIAEAWLYKMRPVLTAQSMTISQEVLS